MVETVLPRLELGKLLGQGSYGRVYRGTYNGKIIAVKARHAPFLAKPWLATHPKLETLARRLRVDLLEAAVRLLVW